MTLHFILKELEGEDDYAVFGLHGFKDALAYGLKLRVSKTLSADAMFQGSDKVQLIPTDGTENFLAAMAAEFSLVNPPTPMTTPYSAFDTVLLDGSGKTLAAGTTRLKIPVGEGGAELVIVIVRSGDGGTVEFVPRTDPQGVLDALGA